MTESISFCFRFRIPLKYRSDYSVFERYVQRNSVSATFLWETTNFFWCVNTLLKPITLYVTLKKDCSLNVALGRQLKIDFFITLIFNIIHSQIADSDSTFIHSKETSNVKLNLRKRKSEITISKSTLDFNSAEKNSTHNFLGAFSCK